MPITGRPHQQRFIVVQSCINRRAGAQQFSQAFFTANACGIYRRVLFDLINGVSFCAGGHQLANDLRIAAECRSHQRRHACNIGKIDVSTRPHQDICQRLVAFACRHVEWRVPFAITRIDRCTLGEQSRHTFSPARLGCQNKLAVDVDTVRPLLCECRQADAARQQQDRNAVECVLRFHSSFLKKR